MTIQYTTDAIDMDIVDCISTQLNITPSITQSILKHYTDALNTKIEENIRTNQLRSPADVVEKSKQIRTTPMRVETLHIFIVNAHHVIQDVVCFDGSRNEINLEPLEVVKRVAQCDGTDVVMIHNHPSGNLLPSEADRSTTQKLQEMLLLFNVGMIDSIIYTENAHYSFAREGILHHSHPAVVSETRATQQQKKPKTKPQKTLQR